MKTLQDWHGTGLDWDKFCKAGDEIDREAYDYFLDILPPIVLERSYFQVGEPYAMAYDKKHEKWRSIYATFAYDLDDDGTKHYYYLGNCFSHEDKDMTSTIGNP